MEVNQTIIERLPYIAVDECDWRSFALDTEIADFC